MIKHTCTPKLIRPLLSFAFTAVMLFTFCPDMCAQTIAHLKHASEKAVVPEDVYFNAEAREISPLTSLAANQVSANSIGRVLSILLNPARVSLQTESDPLIATWSGTITVPTNTAIKPKPKSYIQDLRGSVNKTADTRVTIFLDLGGKSFTLEFPYGMKQDGNLGRRFTTLIKPSAAAGRYTASILIIAERRNPKGAVLVDIDSLDVDAR